MKEQEFSYGPLARGTFIGLACLAPAVLIAWPGWLFHYLLLLVFLAVGLRPLLERTGLYRLWQSLGLTVQERWDRDYLARRRRDIDRRERDKALRARRHREVKPPRNW